jgi:hypothetical protein
MRLHVLALALALALASPLAVAKGGGTHGSYSTGTHGRAVLGVPRDSHGRIKRSGQARAQFKNSHPCPTTGKSSGSCPGYVIDHIQPLKRDGADASSNMQWQTKTAAKAKDRIE